MCIRDSRNGDAFPKDQEKEDWFGEIDGGNIQDAELVLLVAVNSTDDPCVGHANDGQDKVQGLSLIHISCQIKAQGGRDVYEIGVLRQTETRTGLVGRDAPPS